MEINPGQLEPQQRYKLMIGGVVPRPIAFVSTLDGQGQRNVAPFSFFNAVCFNPIILAFFPIRYKKEKELKDTVSNIRETGEFVINVSTEAIAEQVNQASGRYEKSVDEFELTGLTPKPSTKVKPPGVAESPIQFECELERTISFGEDQGGADAVFGKVVHIHVADELIDNDYRIDARGLQPIARLAGNAYSKLGEIFEIERPKV